MAKKILIIDDDIELCEELGEILKDEKYSVDKAVNGSEGKLKIAAGSHDIIILDYKMPGLSGIDVLKFIREKNLKTRIIFASGKPFIEKLLKEENVSDLVSTVIKKPFDINQLLKTIKTL